MTDLVVVVLRYLSMFVGGLILLGMSAFAILVLLEALFSMWTRRKERRREYEEALHFYRQYRSQYPNPGSVGTPKEPRMRVTFDGLAYLEKEEEQC